jgi:ribonuclease R
VKLDTALDREAQLRGNSVYFPGFVVPMLPEHLSNGLCSLKPKEDRLVMVCELNIDKAGQISEYNFYEGVIHSHARLTYTEVAAMLQTPKTDIELTLQQRISNKYSE